MWFRRFEPRLAARLAAEAAERATGPRLLGAALYGSAVAGGFHPAHSDVNVAFVFSALGAEELEALRRIAPVWDRCRVVRPLLLSRDALLRSRDTFPLEYLLIRERHEALRGEDLFAGIAIERAALRLQVERTLRAQELGLGLSYVALAGTRSGARHWAVRAGSAIAASAEGLLWLREGSLAATRRELAARCGAAFGVDAAAFELLLTLRERPREGVEARTLLDAALGVITRLLESAEGLDAPRT
jgi:predicted nucleotidyltransferase